MPFADWLRRAATRWMTQRAMAEPRPAELRYDVAVDGLIGFQFHGSACVRRSLTVE